MSRVVVVTIALWLAILIAGAALSGVLLMALCDGLIGFVRWLWRIAA